MHYSKLKMADYLQLGYENLTITEQRSIFSIRNRMIEIPANFQSGTKIEKCRCGKNENMEHLYICEHLCEDIENTSLAAPGVLAHHLQRRTACDT